MILDEIKLKLKEFLSKNYKLNNLPDDENLFETGIVHSLFYMQLLIFIEKQFNFELSMENSCLSNMNSINAIADLIINNVETK